MANVEQRLQHVESELEGIRADVAGELSAQLDELAATIAQNKFNQDVNWAMWQPAIQQALVKADAAQQNLQKMQIDWPMRPVFGPNDEITIQHEDLNFFIKSASTTTVQVTQGTWERNGYPLAMAVDSGKQYKTLTVGSDGTYYVYLQLASIPYTASIRPDTLTAEISLTIPDNTATYNIYKILGTVVVDGGVIKANGITQQWYGGDIRDYFFLPDGDTIYNIDPLTKTLQINPVDNLYNSEGEMYGAHNVALAGTQDWKSRKGLPYLPKDSKYTGNLAWAGIDSDGTQKSLEIEATSKLAQIYKMDKAPEAAATGMDLCVRTAAAGEVFWVDADTFVSKIDVTVIVDIQFDTATGYIQVKTQDLTVFAKSAVSAWTNKIQAFPCATETVSGQMSVNGVTTDVTVLGAANP
jgi:hypothetical protein